MARGARPGERRGGRAKGTPNRITFTKSQMAMMALAERDRSQQKATAMLNQVMAETYAMAKGYGPQSETYDDDLYRAYLKLTAYAAGRLAPYQDPQLATVKVSSGERPLVVREGVTSKQILEELKQKIRETGLLPSNMVDVTPNKVEGVDAQPQSRTDGEKRRIRSANGRTNA
jgi:catalase (peroxidase I)